MSSAVASPVLTVKTLYDELRARLAAGGIELAGDESRDIIAAVHDAPRFWPVLNAPLPVADSAARRARNAAELRAKGAPFAYAVKRAAFRALTLAVDERVLIPRQETEELVDAILEYDLRGTAIDVGTGSGAIAIALAAEGRFDRVIATDVSLDALAVARENLDRCGSALRAPVELRHGAVLEPVHGERAMLIVSNPPYIAAPESRELPRSVRDWEPPLALYSGVDGMPVTRAIIAGAAAHLESGGLLALEVDCRRAQLVAHSIEATGSFSDITVRLDLSGRERFVLARQR